ncbi:hypothetical protein LB941_06445 [Ligilactobacillus sp. WILCCON 0076]|uniref:Uncharacterized protein n=1 Tax=Ligilactobacillus ubinensis TaxID=2876789 RepID=A0A9X2FJQ5_9LACO|nr:hypothetical protein [Ligilactobacillus ubinensis]MCP0886972.1 hypothetical protein [Ligilactobacillus ubinensis]
MNKEYKVATIIDRYSVAINIAKDEIESLGVGKGDVAKIVQKKVEIKDPETQNILGTYTIYKESLEISDIQDNFIIATNYGYKDGNPLTFALTNSKKKIALNVDKLSPIDTEKDRQIKVGDIVDFFN